MLPAQATDTGTDGDSWVYRADAEVNFTSDLICKDRHYPMVDYAQPQIRSMKHAILTGTKSAVLNPFYFGYLMAEAISGAGLPDDCVLQGLRKSAASALIDAGCTPHQAAAIICRQTMRMLEEYAKRRDQVKLGQAAMLKSKRARK